MTFEFINTTQFPCQEMEARDVGSFRSHKVQDLRDILVESLREGFPSELVVPVVFATGECYDDLPIIILLLV